MIKFFFSPWRSWRLGGSSSVLRCLVAVVLALSVLLVASSAHAGSYLDRATMLLDASRLEANHLRASLTDKELARVVFALAIERSRVAQKMQIPEVVAKAHPHLLLVMTHVERAAEAAIDGNLKAAVEFLEGARREERIFRAVLKELGHSLPPPTRATAGAPRRAVEVVWRS